MEGGGSVQVDKTIKTQKGALNSWVCTEGNKQLKLYASKRGLQNTKIEDIAEATVFSQTCCL